MINRNPWPVWALMTVVLTALLGVYTSDAVCDETIKGYTDSGRVDLKITTKPDGTVITKGYLNGKRYETKTVTTSAGTRTTGYIGSERISIKTKKKD